MGAFCVYLQLAGFLRLLCKQLNYSGMRTLTILALAVVLTGCFGAATTKESARAEDTVVMAGADRDAHGCIGSAGYTWCEVLGNCVRLWEVGVALQPTVKDDNSAVFVAYIVFSKDNKLVEYFAPGEQSEILTAKGDKWLSDKTTLEMSNGSYEIVRDGKIIYKGSKE